MRSLTKLTASSCNGISLSEPPKVLSSFYLSVLAPSRNYSFEYIQASGNQFWVGGSPSTYCPWSNDNPACVSDSNTVFYSNALAVYAPGGQRIFIKKDGTLAFTQAHSAQEPGMAYDGENVAYSHAGYFGPDGHSWAACRPRGSNDRRRIVADLPGVDLETEDCEGVFLYVSELDQGKFPTGPKHHHLSKTCADVDEVLLEPSNTLEHTRERGSRHGQRCAGR